MSSRSGTPADGASGSGRASRRAPIRLYLAVVLVVFLVATMPALVYVRQQAEGDARRAAQSQLRFVARSAANAIERDLGLIADGVRQEAANPSFAAVLAAPADCVLTSTGTGVFTSVRLDVARVDGTVICSSDVKALGAGAGYRGAPWLRATDASPWVAPVHDAVTGHNLAVVAAPIGADGFLIAAVDLRTLAADLSVQVDASRRDRLSVSTSAGTLLARSAGNARTGAVLTSRAAAPAARWRVTATVDKASALAGAHRLANEDVALVLGALVLALVAALVVERRIALPIRRLSSAVRGQASGRTTAAVPVEGPREVVGLAADFNALMYAVDHELAERRVAEEAARASERTYRLLFADNPRPMWLYDPETLAFLDVNDAAVGHYGYARDEFLAMTIADIRPGEDLDALRASVARTAKIDRSGPWRHVTKDGAEIGVEVTSHTTMFEGRPARFVMADDITARLAQEDELRRRALYDELTGLPNRVLVLDRLERALVAAHAAASVVAVLLMDLDRFKLVNNAHGHAFGDRLLVRLGMRLQEAVGAENSVGRLGSDEFVVVCEGLASDSAAMAVAARIEAALAEPFDVDGVETFAPASVGVAVSSEDCDGEELLRDALAAMTRAKELGRARTEVYDPGMHSRTVGRLQTDRDLRHAIDRGELRLFYQPEIDFRTHRFAGAEALIRWEHPERGLILPTEFIGLAEETGLIVPIGEWVLGEAMRQAALWRADERWPAVVSVNVSVRQLGEPDFVAEVRRAIEGAGVEPSALCLEMTESSLMDAAAVPVLRTLRDMGVGISLDDFGTGYSSLVYLRQFPLDFVKIDRQFVAGLRPGSQDSAIVSAVIDLAHALGLTVVAEGVETEEQAFTLAGMGCDIGQGFLWSRPLPASEWSLTGRVSPR